MNFLELKVWPASSCRKKATFSTHNNCTFIRTWLLPCAITLFRLLTIPTCWRTNWEDLRRWKDTPALSKVDVDVSKVDTFWSWYISTTSTLLEYPKQFLTGNLFYVSVDIWDGPEMPVVYHGNTLTTKIAFSDVVSVISQFAFEASKSVLKKPREKFLLNIYLITIWNVTVSAQKGIHFSSIWRITVQCHNRKRQPV